MKLKTNLPRQLAFVKSIDESRPPLLVASGLTFLGREMINVRSDKLHFFVQLQPPVGLRVELEEYPSWSLWMSLLVYEARHIGQRRSDLCWLYRSGGILRRQLAGRVN